MKSKLPIWESEDQTIIGFVSLKVNDDNLDEVDKEICRLITEIYELKKLKIARDSGEI